MIYYFSATGNSKHVAERIAEALNDRAQSIETAGAAIALQPDEHLGLVTPTNWNELPVFVREFIQKTDIRLAQNNYVFCVATYGFLQGFVCEDARRELRKKGIGMDAGFLVFARPAIDEERLDSFFFHFYCFFLRLKIHWCPGVR